MARLKIVKGQELAAGMPTEMQLPEPLLRFSIGRDPANTWALPDRSFALSARHCEIVATAAGAVLRDVSTNGTFLNGAKARLAGEHVLSDGDRFELGPYTMAFESSPRPSAAAPAAQRPGSLAPGRGGDPAAMFAIGAQPARQSLTEILRHAPPPDDSGQEMTKIRPAAPRAPAPEREAPAAASKSVAVDVPLPTVAPAPVRRTPAAVSAPPAAPVAAPAPVPHPSPTPPPPPFAARPPLAAPSGASPFLRELALGLGLPAEALAGRDPAQTVARVAGLARAAVTVLRQLLEQQAQERRMIGSRSPVLAPVREGVNTLRLGATPEAALLALLAPGNDVAASLQRAGAELAAHRSRLMAAFRGAAARLGDEMAPASLEAALGGAGEGSASLEQRARLWELYAQLWDGVGLAPGLSWSEGFLEAALLHLATVYDEQNRQP